MSGKRRRAVIAGAVAVVLVAALIAGRGWISSRSYFRTADRLSSSMPAALQTKYGGELEDAVDKFWKCYKLGTCSRNDMTDVMDYMKRLISEGDITDSDIFEFLGFVTRLYTDRLDEYHRETIRRNEEERQSDM